MTARAPSVALCIVQLALVRFSMRVLGFGRTVAHVEQSQRATTYPMSVDDPMIDQIAQSVAAAAALYPGRARCLEQSLILSRALRRHGADAKLRFGVHPYPFGAHAWVEVLGRAVNEPDDYLKMFTPLED